MQFDQAVRMMEKKKKHIKHVSSRRLTQEGNQTLGARKVQPCL